MKRLALLLLVNLPLWVFSQNQLELPSGTKTNLTLAYFGNNLWNPGLKFGLEQCGKDSYKSVKRRGKDKIITKYWFLKGDIGGYWDPRSHVGLFANVGIGRRKLRPSGVFTHWGISPLGLYRSFYPETYEVLDDGTVQQISAAGRAYFSPVLTLGFGKPANRNVNRNWFFNFHVMGLNSYNGHWLPLLNIEYGYFLN